MKIIYLCIIFGLGGMLRASENIASPTTLSDAQRLILGVLDCYANAQQRQVGSAKQATLRGELSPKEVFQLFCQLDPDLAVNHPPECITLRGQLDELGRQHLAAAGQKSEQ